jgi:hypothetical protein
LLMDIEVTSATLNSGLTAAQFAIPTVNGGQQ